MTAINVGEGPSPTSSDGYDAHVRLPEGDNWLAVTDRAIAIGDLYEWVVKPDCGAVVLFSGTVRDHADGRTDVTHLEYEAYEQMVIPRFDEIVVAARRRWDGLGRIAIVHRLGSIAVGESSVVVAVSAPHRADAFEAARYGIDALKVSVPIWKREFWSAGADWGTGAASLVSAGQAGEDVAPDARSVTVADDTANMSNTSGGE